MPKGKPPQRAGTPAARSRHRRQKATAPPPQEEHDDEAPQNSGRKFWRNSGMRSLRVRFRMTMDSPRRPLPDGKMRLPSGCETMPRKKNGPDIKASMAG
jgi:hypothetical protein